MDHADDELTRLPEVVGGTEAVGAKEVEQGKGAVGGLLVGMTSVGSGS